MPKHEKTLAQITALCVYSIRCDVFYGTRLGPHLPYGSGPALQPFLAHFVDPTDSCLHMERLPSRGFPKIKFP